MSDNILKEADQLTSGDRQEQYGHPADAYHPVAQLWKAYLASKGIVVNDLDAEDVCMMMALLKIGREMVREKRDNLVDACGYLRTVEMVRQRGEQECEALLQAIDRDQETCGKPVDFVTDNEIVTAPCIFYPGHPGICSHGMKNEPPKPRKRCPDESVLHYGYPMFFERESPGSIASVYMLDLDLVHFDMPACWRRSRTYPGMHYTSLPRLIGRALDEILRAQHRKHDLDAQVFEYLPRLKPRS